MFAMFRIILALKQLARGSREFLDENERLIEEHDPENITMFSKNYRRILFFGYASMILGGIMIPLLTPWMMLVAGQFSGVQPAVVTTVLSALFCPLLSFFFLFVGVAFGCLIAPPEFLQTSFGAKWMEFVGTKSPVGAKIVCFLLTFAGVAMVSGTVVLQAIMINSPGLNK